MFLNVHPRVAHGFPFYDIVTSYITLLALFLTSDTASDTCPLLVNLSVVHIDHLLLFQPANVCRALGIYIQPQEAKRELSDGLQALDKQGDKRLPPSSIVTALKRMGIELRMKQREAEKALRVFEVPPLRR